jgi:hypothetical protein
MLHDGTRGVCPLKRNGACSGPGPATARAASMSFSAIATGCVEFVLPPHRLAAALVALTMAPGAPACSLSPPRTGRAWELNRDPRASVYGSWSRDCASLKVCHWSAS